ncbi:hypothetical protein [Zhihengliuella halotolerans]|uniref:Uncharacterized protein n=1 Tax=Zhihengliuella halotolerans TaxID=370736 RepID=A0A4Q8AC15_9MICC|nr:hypothetical protein [Zhihengliuella halotolerans]RZU61722.1 hypothetical protein EV380_1300 [Zhihengliuella halotolerans]
MDSCGPADEAGEVMYGVEVVANQSESTSVEVLDVKPVDARNIEIVEWSIGDAYDDEPRGGIQFAEDFPDGLGGETIIDPQQTGLIETILVLQDTSMPGSISGFTLTYSDEGESSESSVSTNGTFELKPYPTNCL